MPLNIQISTPLDQDELDALAALIASLGGSPPVTAYGDYDGLLPREPSAGPTIGMPDGVRTAVLKTRVADTVSTADGSPLSEDLLREEANRAAGRPTGSASDGTASSAGDSATPERDGEGLPWDERIHSSNRALNADGTWRKRRGVDEVTVGRVTAELQSASDPIAEHIERVAEAADVPTQVIAPPPPPPTDNAHVAPGATPFPEGNVPPPPPPVAALAPTASGAVAATTAPDGVAKYQAFMKRVASAGLDYAKLNEQAQVLGLDKFAGLAKRFDLVDDFAGHLEAMGLLSAEG